MFETSTNTSPSSIPAPVFAGPPPPDVQPGTEPSIRSDAKPDEQIQAAKPKKKQSYVSASEKAAEWNISARRMQILLRENRIPGAIRLGRVWGVPASAKKPDDKRRKKQPDRKQKPEHTAQAPQTLKGGTDGAGSSDVFEDDFEDVFDE